MIDRFIWLRLVPLLVLALLVAAGAVFFVRKFVN